MRWAASDVSPSSHLAFHIPTLAGFCLLFVFWFLFGFVALVCFCFLFCECLGIPNSPRSLDLDDRQGLIARSAMQQKKKIKYTPWRPYSALLRKCGQRNVHFPRGKHTFCQRPRSRKGGGVADAVHSANSNSRSSGFKQILLLFNRMTPPTARFNLMTPPITRA